MAVFQASGIRFQYPDNWRLTREDADNGWTASVQSPDTAFFMVSYDENMPDIEDVTRTVLDALRTDYPELEAEEILESLAGQPAFGHDIRFFSLDLTNTCCTRVFYGEAGTILVLWQTNDLELEQWEPIFRAMRASLRIDSPDDGSEATGESVR